MIIVYFAGMTSMEFLLKTGLTRVREKHPTAAIILSVTMDEETWKFFDNLNFLVIPDPTRAVRAASASDANGARIRQGGTAGTAIASSARRRAGRNAERSRGKAHSRQGRRSRG